MSRLSSVRKRILLGILCMTLVLPGGVMPAQQVKANTESNGDNMYNRTRTDIRDESIYTILITRFYDGDSENNVHCWDDGMAGNPDSDPAWRGDFKGLLEKLDYVQAMGFTTICLSPVTTSASGYDYDGIHPYDFSRVDPRLESDGFTYQDVINVCHKRGLKVIQQIVLNHTSNFGEANLLPVMERGNFTEDISNDIKVGEMTDAEGNVITQTMYDNMSPRDQYMLRLENLQKSEFWRSAGSINFDDYTSQNASIAGDCVDLNTENPKVYNYLVDVYSEYIKMGVDGFWINSSKHISRLTYNKVFNDAFLKAGKKKDSDFVIYGDGVIRNQDVWYQDQMGLSNPFYTWDESSDYQWSDTDASINEASAVQLTKDAVNNDAYKKTSSNAVLNGITYHEPDYSETSGMYMNDFQFMWNAGSSNWFSSLVNSDKYYNDATYNMVSLENFEYGPSDFGSRRMERSVEEWWEQLALMFLFRGVPMVYQGTEAEFQKESFYDMGPNAPLSSTVRAYYGDCLEGDVEVSGPLTYSNATGAVANNLINPVSKQIQLLNLLRREIPALRKGQYTVNSEYVSGDMAFIKRYTDDEIDSLALVTISGKATFKNIPNGTYINAVDGQVQNVSNGTLTTNSLSRGKMTIYVCCTKGFTGIDGKIGNDFTNGTGIGNQTYYDNIVGEPYVEATGINVDKDVVNILDTGSEQVTASILPEDATNQNFVWTSSDEDVATVKDGLIQGVNAGTAIVKVRIGGTQICKEIVVNVTNNPNHIYPETVVATPCTVMLNKGESQDIVVTLSPDNVTKKTMKWMSYDPSIATVDKHGKITAIEDGMTCIVGKTMNGKQVVVPITVGKTLSLDDDLSIRDSEGGVEDNVIYFAGKPEGWGNNLNIYAWDANGSSLFGNWPGAAMSYDDTLGMYYYVHDTNLKNANIIINDGTSNQTSDLAVNGNCYNATTGTWSNNEKKSNGKVMIDYHTLEGFVLSRKIVSGQIDSEYQFLANDYAGYLLAQQPENANGTYSADGAVVSYVYGNTNVTSVSLDESSLSFTEAGATKTLSALVEPITAIDKSVTWKSSNDTVAKVSEDGVVTAVANGTAIITVTTKDGDCTDACNVVVDIPEPLLGGSGEGAATPLPGGSGEGTATPQPGGSGEGVVEPQPGGSGEGTTVTPPKNNENNEDKKEPNKQVSVVGTIVTSDDGKATYKIITSELGNRTVTYIAPTNKKATTIIIPDVAKINGVEYKVTGINNNAFTNLKKLKTIKMGKGITQIGDNAFSGCKKLKNVTLGKNVTTIGTKAFYKCESITIFTLPAKVKKIGTSAFEGCKKIRQLYIKTKKLTKNNVKKKAFKGVGSKYYKKVKVKVPGKKYVKTYKTFLRKSGLSKKIKITK